MAVVVALVTCLVLMVVAALTVDIGNTWARRGKLQVQADLAAKYAAQALPVDSTTVGGTPTSSQTAVAKAAAFYLACHPVAGQSTLNALPTCPSAATYLTDTGIATLASSLLSNGVSGASSTRGSITFPTTNQVRVVAPSARVQFGFGRAVGAEESIQTREATAIVLSPGQVLPVGMSLTCLANSLGTAPVAGNTLSAVMPINYISAGIPATSTSTSGLLAPTWTDLAATSANITTTLSTPSPITPGALLGTSTVGVNYAVNTVASVFGSGYTVSSTTLYFRKYANPAAGAAGQVTNSVILLPSSPHTATVDLSAGTWQVKIGVTATKLLNPTKTFYSSIPLDFTVLPKSSVLSSVAKTDNFVSCSRPVQSPRLGFTSGTEDANAMAINIAQGLDHPTAAYPGVATALAALNLSGASAVSSLASSLSNPSVLLTCGAAASVKKDYPTRRTDGANCFHVDTSQDWATSMTQGLLTGGSFSQGSFNGRLYCASASGCNHSASRAVLTNPGGISGTYNNDYFEDFILNNGYLQDPFLYSLDTFLSTSLPVVTPPNDTIDPALYSSPRFFWAPVAVNAYTTTGSGAAGDYPILSYRPVFLTPKVDSTITTPVDELSYDLVTRALAGGYSLTQVLTSVVSAVDLVACLVSPTMCEIAQLAKQSESDLNGILGSLTTNTTTTGGLVIDTAAKKVRAARFMTITPGALPAPPQTYTGPTTAYLGIGPKIVRLVK